MTNKKRHFLSETFDDIYFIAILSWVFICIILMKLRNLLNKN